MDDIWGEVSRVKSKGGVAGGKAGRQSISLQSRTLLQRLYKHGSEEEVQPLAMIASKVRRAIEDDSSKGDAMDQWIDKAQDALRTLLQSVQGLVSMVDATIVSERLFLEGRDGGEELARLARRRAERKVEEGLDGGADGEKVSVKVAFDWR